MSTKPSKTRHHLSCRKQRQGKTTTKTQSCKTFTTISAAVKVRKRTQMSIKPNLAALSNKLRQRHFHRKNAKRSKSYTKKISQSRRTIVSSNR